MKLSFFDCLLSAYFLFTATTFADKALDGNTVGDAFCLKDGQGGERKGILGVLGSCDPLAGVLGFANQRKHCYWAANVWVWQHDLSEVFTSSSTNTCGHCTTNFTCMAKGPRNSLWRTDDPDVYERAQITAADIYNGLQSALSTCNPADGVCTVEWLNEECLVQTYIAEQLGPTNCPDAPCLPGDATCEILDGNTCGDECSIPD